MKSSFHLYIFIVIFLYGCLSLILWLTDDDPISNSLPTSITLICAGLVNILAEFGRFGYLLLIKYITGGILIVLGLTYSIHPIVWGVGLLMLITAILEQYWTSKK